MSKQTEIQIVKPDSTSLQIAEVKYQSTNLLVQAVQGKMIKHCTDLEVVTALSENIEKARFDLGLKADISIEDNKTFVKSVLLDVRTFFYTLAITEVPHVFHRGVRGKYNEGQVFLSVANIGRWFAQYMIDQDRKEAKIELKRLSEPPPYVPTDEEKEQIRLNDIKHSFDTWKAEGKFEDWNNVCWDAIQKYRAIVFDEPDRIKFGQAAKQALFEANSKPARSIGERNKQAAFRQALAEGHAKKEIAIEAKKIALREFFRQLAEMDIDIIDWLKQTDVEP